MNDLALFSCETPWAILESSMLAMQAREKALTPEARFTITKDFKLADVPILSVDANGIATLSVTGPLMRKPSMFAQAFYGATDFGEIEDAAREAAKDPAIRGVLLDIDSPGGTVNGTPEAGNAIAELSKSKPVVAFTNGLMASAAYWVGSQADAVYSTTSATLGSIGVILVSVDSKRYYENAGFSVEVFASGKFKGAGISGTSLSDEQRAHLEGRIADMAKDFKSAVLARGRDIPADAMEGQTFTGKGAQAVNLSAVVRDKAQALGRLQTLMKARALTRK